MRTTRSMQPAYNHHATGMQTAVLTAVQVLAKEVPTEYLGNTLVLEYPTQVLGLRVRAWYRRVVVLSTPARRPSPSSLPASLATRERITVVGWLAGAMICSPACSQLNENTRARCYHSGTMHACMVRPYSCTFISTTIIQSCMYY